MTEWTEDNLTYRKCNGCHREICKREGDIWVTVLSAEHSLWVARQWEKGVHYPECALCNKLDREDK